MTGGKHPHPGTPVPSTAPAAGRLLAADLEDILHRTEGLWSELCGERIFITGGTGFFGCWLLESLTWAVDRLGLDTSAVVLTRNAEAFRRKAPHLAGHPAVQCLQGDVRTFDFPPGQFSHVVHAATDVSNLLNEENPLLVLDTAIEGTRRVLELARHAGARKFLLTSSGAVYGRQPPELTRLPEDHPGGPSPADPRWAYAEGKRAAEMLCALYARQHGLSTVMARCFSFVGPYLSLDIHFAISNFLRDRLQGRPIHVQGDGTPHRSFLYAADLALWLWTLLFRGRPGQAYNVGSESVVSIQELAEVVARAESPPCPVLVARPPSPGVPPERYVPSTQKARTELGLAETVALHEAIERTLAWHRARRAP